MAGDDLVDPNVIYFGEEIVAESLQSCSRSLIGTILANQKFSVGTLEAALGAIWSHRQDLRSMDGKVSDVLEGNARKSLQFATIRQVVLDQVVSTREWDIIPNEEKGNNHYF
ncbi:hypothetical protein PIB30_088385 [Stylosanthes scabra]|uniref:Uncharacterized protein n=1 Tax=Stylosanthes scabra TaxID=79078 RepID=A0ABU6XTJ4_9FABA|nr:hypothetical protein [Stylosanthes scabra]